MVHDEVVAGQTIYYLLQYVNDAMDLDHRDAVGILYGDDMALGNDCHRYCGINHYGGYRSALPIKQGYRVLIQFILILYCVYSLLKTHGNPVPVLGAEGDLTEELMYLFRICGLLSPLGPLFCSLRGGPKPRGACFCSRDQRHRFCRAGFLYENRAVG